MKKSLFLIDGNSLINRAFYALPPLTNVSGEPTNAVYGLTMMLLRLQEDYAPDHMLVAFDVSGPTFRHEQYTEYKANRKGMPDDLRTQLPMMKDVLDALGITRLEKPGFEADDLIGTVAKQGEAEGYQVYIVTGDRDSFQLISPQTRVLFTKRGITDTELVDEERLLKEYGVTPEQVKDLKGLMGDSSDNIPGVPGVGEKTALKLLDSYASVDGVYANIGEIKGKLQERLIENEEQARLSKELATINCTVPVEVDLGVVGEPDYAKTQELFQHLGFRTLLERLPQAEVVKSTPQKDYDINYETVTEDNFRELVELCQSSEAVYLATVGELEQLLCLVEDKMWVLSYDFVLNRREELKGLFQDKEIHCSSSKDLQHLLMSVDKPLPINFDLELALYCLNPEGRWDFPTLAHHYGQPAPALSLDELGYQVAYLRLVAAVAPLIEAELQKNALWSLYKEIELPLAFVLASMEAQGILVDAEKLQEISADLEATLAKLTESIYAEAGEEVNINSPKQLGVILFDKMGLPVLKRTKTGPSTSAEVLEELSNYPIVGDVLEYRQVAKLKSTYADALGELISPETKRIHTTFNQTVTATGRLSSTHPNLQNIPVRTEEGRRIREAFVAPAGYYLVSADYSQIELRLLAHLSGDEALIQAFRSGKDIHAQTASEVFGLPLAEVTSEYRNAAKAINFGIVYGISSFGLAKGINLTRAQAQAYIDSYFERYPKVKAFLDGSVEAGKKQGYVTTLKGRRRYLPDLKSRNFNARNFAARTAMNSPIQGSAADIIKLAMLHVSKAIQQSGFEAKLLLQVHDELVFEVPQKELDAFAQLIKKEMEGVMELDVPLIVEVFYGPNWRDVQPLQLKESN